MLPNFNILSIAKKKKEECQIPIFYFTWCAYINYAIIIIIIIWTLQHSVACDDIKIVVKVAERNADRQHQNRVVKLRKIYM